MKEINESPLQLKATFLVFILKGAVPSCLCPAEGQFCKSYMRKIFPSFSLTLLCNGLNIFYVFFFSVSYILFFTAFTIPLALGGMFSLSQLFLG